MTTELKNRVRLIRALEPSFMQLSSRIRQDVNTFLALGASPKTVTYREKGKKRSTTIGRFIRRSYNDFDLSDFALSIINDVIISSHPDIFRHVKVVRGKKVTELYDQGFGCSSCMTGRASEYTVLYAKNWRKVSLVTFEFDKYQSRALLWLTDSKKTVLDRIYPQGTPGKYVLEQWADLNGHILYYNLDSNETVTLSTKDVEYYPYADTFKYGEFYRNKVSLSTHAINGVDCILDSVDGCVRGLPFCDQCGSMCREESYYGEDDEVLCVGCYQEYY